jgi:hypothetical protein
MVGTALFDLYSRSQFSGHLRKSGIKHVTCNDSYKRIANHLITQNGLLVLRLLGALYGRKA